MNDNENKNRFYWVYLIGFFIILALPLLNLPPWFLPADWGKIVIFRVVVSILLFLFISQIITKREIYDYRRLIADLRGYKLILWLLIALGGIYLLATIFSLDRNFSLWGSPYRSGGFINFAFYIIFAILAFLIIRRENWQKIWIFSFIIGVCVSLIAVFQQFGFFKELFITFGERPPSTIGGPIFLAIYLLLLSFPCLSFGLKTKKIIGKLFYFLSFLFFIFVAVFITLTRAVMIGLAVGIFYFLFFYPFRKKWFSRGLKFATLVILLFGIYGIYFINTQTELPQLVQGNKLLRGVAARLSIKAGLADPRVSGWKVSLEALKNKPIFGYGPENFSIGFDKYYDPSLPGIEKPPGGGILSWWDRAHNFIFDISVTAGIPALVIYLLLFGVLFFKLQGLKRDTNIRMHTNDTNKPIIVHGMQATFIGYLVANFFSFDTFSSYLISFLLISYSLFLITQFEKSAIAGISEGVKSDKKIRRTDLWKLLRYKKTTIFLLFVCLIWFIWAYNIKPLKINAEINAAKHLVGDKKCEQALSGMEKYVLPQKSILNYYARAKYIDFMRDCEKEYFEETLEYVKKGFEISKESVEIRPTYTRNWLFLSGFNAMLISAEKDQQKKAELVKNGEEYLKKAEELSPKRQEVFIEWLKYAFVSARYELMKEKAQRCVDVNPKLADCYWYRGLAQIILMNLEEGKKDIELAREKGYSCDSFISLDQLKKAHSIAKNYEELVLVYQKLIALKPEESQYYATLAFVYRELGQKEKAREEALKALELLPEAKADVEAFLKSLE